MWSLNNSNSTNSVCHPQVTQGGLVRTSACPGAPSCRRPRWSSPGCAYIYHLCLRGRPCQRGPAGSLPGTASPAAPPEAGLGKREPGARGGPGQPPALPAGPALPASTHLGPPAQKAGRRHTEGTEIQNLLLFSVVFFLTSHGGFCQVMFCVKKRDIVTSSSWMFPSSRCAARVPNANISTELTAARKPRGVCSTAPDRCATVLGPARQHANSAERFHCGKTPTTQNLLSNHKVCRSGR